MADVTSSQFLKPGTTIAGKYDLRRCLEMGGMGTVWEAYQPSLDQLVAIKVLSRQASSPAALRRFAREVRLAARLGQACPNIVRVLDSGSIQLPEGGVLPFLVMELLRGRTLSAVLEEAGVLPLERAASIVLELCRALTVTHRARVVHRDIKPSNLFLCDDEEREERECRLKLIDFGIARVESDDPTTEAGVVIGTVPYMSPEQLAGARDIGRAADIWAVAAVTYRMVLGVAPFGMGPSAEVASRIVSAPVQAPSSLRPELPEAFDRWVERGLAKHPADRFSSAAEMAQALARVVGVETGEASQWSVQSGAMHPSNANDTTVSLAPLAPLRRRMGWKVVSTLVAVVAMVLAGLWTLAPLPQRPNVGEGPLRPAVPTTSARLFADAPAARTDSSTSPAAASPAPSTPPHPASTPLAPAPVSPAPSGGRPVAPPRATAAQRGVPRTARDGWLDTSQF